MTEGGRRMIQEDFINAYIWLLSGAAKMKNEKEMWWENERGVTIEFPDLTLDKAIVRSYWDNGNKHWECEYIKGIKHGKEIIWWINGNKRWEEEWINDVLQGKGLEWHADGELCREC